MVNVNPKRKEAGRQRWDFMNKKVIQAQASTWIGQLTNLTTLYVFLFRPFPLLPHPAGPWNTSRWCQ